MIRCEHLCSPRTLRTMSVVVLTLAVAFGTSAVAGPGADDDLTLALGSVTQTSTTDFAAGTHTGTAIGETDLGAAGGQVRLASPLNDIFLAPTLDPQWVATQPSGYTPVIENGTIDVQEREGSPSLSAFQSVATFTSGVVFEARAMIEPGSRFLYLGLTSSTTSSGQWAYFGTRGSGDTPVPVMKTSVQDSSGGVQDITTSSTLGEWHVYRIVWTPGALEFYIDDQLVDSRAGVGITLPQHVGFYKSSGSDSQMLIDWVRLTPYSASPGTFESSVLDAGVAGATWLQLDHDGDEPAATGIAFETRTGETATVDGAWSVWSAVTGGAIANPVGRYAQYRATLTSGDLTVGPVLDEVRLTFNRLDIAPPNVISVSPPDGAGDILPGSAMMASFDEALDPATVTTASFTVTPAGGSPVAATASYDSTSFGVMLVPSAPLAHSTSHEVRLTTAITDTDGNPLAADHVWTFTTIDPDLTAPTVLATEPVDGALAVLANRRVTATFDEPLDPATVDAASATLSVFGGAVVPATVSYEEGTATVVIDPDADLTWDEEYEVRLTTAIADLAGNSLAADEVWTFHTRETAPFCEVATASTDFVQGTSTGLVISEVDSSDAGGQLRLQGYLNDTFDSPTLSPIWHATNPEGYAPAIADGILDVQEYDPVYMDQSSIESNEAWGPGVVLEARAMFVPGSDFIDVGFDSSTNGNAQYAWFSTAGTGGENGDQLIVARVREYDHNTVGIETGASFNQWHVFKIVWVQGQVDFYVDGALVATHTDVAITAPMRAALFKSGGSETPFYVDWIRVTPYTESVGTYESPVFDGGIADAEWTDLSWLGSTPDLTDVVFSTRTGSTAAPDGTWSDWADVADGLVVSPVGRFAQYRAELTTADNLVSPVIDEVQLCHGGDPDTTPPVVTATVPADGAVDVVPSAPVSAVFDEPLDPATLTPSSFTLTPQGGSPVPATIAYDVVTRTATLTADADLADLTLYTAELTTAVTNTSGLGLAAPVTWSFTTGIAPDLTPPTVLVVDPVGGATDVPFDATVAATFSEPVDPATLTEASFTLTPEGGAAIAATVGYDAVNWIATLTPQAPLAAETLYEARLTTAVADTAGNVLAADHVWSFTTLAIGDLAQVVPVPDQGAVILCDGQTTLAFRYVPSGFDSGIRGYDVRITATEEVSFGEADFTVATLPADAEVFHEVITNGPGDYSVHYTILGADTDGIDVEADLFTVAFHGESAGAATVAVVSADLRDLGNQTVPVYTSLTATIDVQCELPDPATALVAVPDHEQVTLTWQDPASPALASVEVFRARWEDAGGASAYPRYGRLADISTPVRPADHAAAVADPRWTSLGTFAPGEMTLVDAVVERDIYAYEIFGFNGFGQVGPPAQGAVAATNYFLGDVEGGDGDVDILDVTAFGDVYDTEEGDAAFNPVMDFGPTSDSSGFGLPLPDGMIGFEDLVIIGLTFGTGVPAAAEVAPLARFAWLDLGEGRYALRLAEGEGVKAVRLSSSAGGGAIAVTAGALVAEQSAPTFLRNAGSGLDAGFAVLGRGVGLTGTGEIIVVSGIDGSIGIDDLVLDVRGADGSTIEAEVESAVTGVATPGAYALMGNFPNPFNPSTTIRFSLPEAATVRLAIYGIDGRLVTTLVDEVRQAGVHDVIWRGQDDRGGTVSSGAYFYRIESGSFRDVRKMVLLK